jgi:hypothetical protein
VSVGVTLTAVPLVAAIFPGVITPVPPVKTPVRLVVPPAVTVVGLATKRVIAGAAALTVTVAVCTAEPPEVFVTVRIYVVVWIGETLTDVPLVTLMFPGVMTPVPLVKTPVKPVDPPAVTAVGLAAKLVIIGCQEFGPE